MIDQNSREVFVKNMHRFMDERGITQADIAARMQLTPSTVSDWYNGKNYPRVDAMQRLASLFDVSMRELTTETDDEYTLSSDEVRLLSGYRSLTPEGREKVQAYLSDIAMLYRSEKNNSVPISVALK